MRAQYSPFQSLLEPVVQSLGFVLYGIERFNSGRREMLRVYIDRDQDERDQGRGVSLDDCAEVHVPLERVLHGNGASLYLEVSSPGMDRLLFTPEQLAAATGSVVTLRTTSKINGRRRFTGKLQSVDANGNAVLLVDGECHAIAVSEIERARLALPEKL